MEERQGGREGKSEGREDRGRGEQEGRGRGRVREGMRKRTSSQPILRWALTGFQCKNSHPSVSCGYDSEAEGVNYQSPSQHCNETGVQLTTTS